MPVARSGGGCLVPKAERFGRRPLRAPQGQHQPGGGTPSAERPGDETTANPDSVSSEVILWSTI